MWQTCRKEYKWRHDSVERYVHSSWKRKFQNSIGFHHRVGSHDRSKKTRYCDTWLCKERDNDYRRGSARRYKKEYVIKNEKRSRNAACSKAKLWQMKKVVVVPIVVEALAVITTKFENHIGSLRIEIRTKHVHKSALVGTARIIRMVLSCQVPIKGYCCETFDIWLMVDLTAKTKDTKISALLVITLNMLIIRWSSLW